jgi:hypothetical protein
MGHHFANYTVADKRLVQISFNQPVRTETERKQDIGNYGFQASSEGYYPTGRNLYRELL